MHRTGNREHCVYREGTDRIVYWGGPDRNWSYLGGISLPKPDPSQVGISERTCYTARPHKSENWYSHQPLIVRPGRLGTIDHPSVLMQDEPSRRWYGSVIPVLSRQRSSLSRRVASTRRPYVRVSSYSKFSSSVRHLWMSSRRDGRSRMAQRSVRLRTRLIRRLACPPLPIRPGRHTCHT